MSKKLQNVKAIQQMLDGTHKFQTKNIVGFSDAEDAAKKNERHDVGDIWEEKDPVSGVIYIVEQREGFRIKKTNNADVLQGVRDDLRAFPNCRKETCTCAGTHHLDKKMKVIHGMCFDCTIEMEHELKKAGTFNAYAYNKMRENALAWLQSAERDVEMLKEIYTQASKFVTNSDGITETWSAKMSPEEFEQTIQSDFNKYKEEFIEKINKEYPHEKID
jgi:hypothetical protein